jgi:hypothetical protein
VKKKCYTTNTRTTQHDNRCNSLDTPQSHQKASTVSSPPTQVINKVTSSTENRNATIETHPIGK